MQVRVANPREEAEPLRNSLAEAAPAAALALLLVLATWLDGAFDLRYWAPIAVFGLAALVVAQIAGGIRIEPGPRLLAAIAIWAFAGWTALSAVWADSAGLAAEGAARTVLYAALVTAALAIPSRRLALRVGSLVIGAIAVIVLSTLVALYTGGAEHFLAGRLDDPIGYRNGTATLFAFAFWPLLGAAAPRGGNPALRGAAIAFAVLALGLAFLTQSRGVVIGLVLGGLVSLAIGPDRIRRAWAAIAALGAVAIASGSLLAPYHAFQDGGNPTDSDVHQAAVALTVLALAVFGLGLLVALYDNGLRVSQRKFGRRLGGGGLAVVAVVAVVGALAAIGNPASYASDKWDEFTDLNSTTSSGSTRLGSVGGQRYDLWRVSWKEFKSEPITGVGEGNYLFDYYRDRRTDRNLSDPHSLPFRLLAETGLVGALLFGGFLLAIGVAIARAARSASDTERRVIAGLAAAGAVVLGQSTTDWLWLIPTVTGLALLCLGLAAAPPEEPTDAAPADAEGADDEQPRGAARTGILRYGPAVLCAAAAIAVSALFLSDLYIRAARSEAGRDPDAQLSAARTAADLNPLAITPLYLEASALETMGDRSAARDELNDALAKEPQNFVTLAVLGDLEVRAGRLEQAKAYYARAAELNPLDVGLRQLAKNGPREP